MNSSSKWPDSEKLEQKVRAETSAKLAAIAPLTDAYTQLLRARDEFAEHDAANVAALSQARSDALKAGFDTKTLDQLGFTQVTELQKPSHSRKTAAKPKTQLSAGGLSVTGSPPAQSRVDVEARPAAQPER